MQFLLPDLLWRCKNQANNEEKLKQSSALSAVKIMTKSTSQPEHVFLFLDWIWTNIS